MIINLSSISNEVKPWGVRNGDVSWRSGLRRLFKIIIGSTRKDVMQSSPRSCGMQWMPLSYVVSKRETYPILSLNNY